VPVVDASVYVAMLDAGEANHARSWAWFELMRREGQPIVAPVILVAEVASALSRGTGDARLAHQATRRLRESVVVELVPVSEALGARAAEIAADHRIRGCDAIYVALADQLGDTLVTLDRQQLERAAGRVQVMRP
jgi:predicted nucleic acid-binding protein